jgi:hypothetical protein
MVTAADVWDALAEIPDPEIPVVSLVELGVVKGVEVENGNVRVDFTPTFLGCPALEVMQQGHGVEDRRARRDARDHRPPRRLVVDRRHLVRGAREASGGRLRAAHPEAGRDGPA